MKARWGLVLMAGILAAGLCMTGCGGSDSDGESNSIIGAWNWNSIVINGITANFQNPAASTLGGSTTVTAATITQVAAAYGMAGVNVTLTITFNDDGTATGTFVATATGERPETITGTGTWTVNGDRLTLTVNVGGQTVVVAGTYTASGSRLTISMSSADLQQALGSNPGLSGEIPPMYQQLLASLSGSIVFTK